MVWGEKGRVLKDMRLEGMGKRMKEIDLKGHDNIREDPCDQIIPLIWRFAREDILRMISKEEGESGWTRHLYLSYTT
jgi:hypothetical protein